MTQIKFNRTIRKWGESLGHVIPPEIIQYLQLKEGDQIEIIPEKNKKGQVYAAYWKKK